MYIYVHNIWLYIYIYNMLGRRASNGHPFMFLIHKEIISANKYLALVIYF